MSHKDKDVLRQLYIEEDLSMKEVGEKLNCSSSTVSYWVNKFGFDTGRLTDEERSEISLTNRQHSLIKGVLMGDGCVVRRKDDNKNPQFRVVMKNEKFINWLSDELQPLTSSVKGRSGKYAETLDNPQHVLTTYSHPLLQQYADWYNDGKKRWPVDKNLSELELLMLYVTDGTPVKHTDNWAAGISAINEADRKEPVADMFKRSFDIDITWHSSDLDRDGLIYIPSADADIIWENAPPPGFEYKWPDK